MPSCLREARHDGRESQSENQQDTDADCILSWKHDAPMLSNQVILQVNWNYEHEYDHDSDDSSGAAVDAIFVIINLI